MLHSLQAPYIHTAEMVAKLSNWAHGLWVSPMDSFHWKMREGSAAHDQAPFPESVRWAPQGGCRPPASPACILPGTWQFNWSADWLWSHIWWEPVGEETGLQLSQSPSGLTTDCSLCTHAQLMVLP